jgi:uncharacterized protein (TIGR03086 family)
MTQQSMPNPIELFEAASNETRKILANVRPHQMNDRTPCAEWDVQALVNHIVGVPAFVNSLLNETPPSQPKPDQAPLAAFDANVAATLRAARAPGALEKKVKAPFGEVTGAQLLMIGWTDPFIHSWDLAKATKQDTTLNPRLVEICATVLKPMLEGGRSANAFGPEVKVPATASALDKLVALTGRNPNWT